MESILAGSEAIESSVVEFAVDRSTRKVCLGSLLLGCSHLKITVIFYHRNTIILIKRREET
jgi:hypothetical protein